MTAENGGDLALLGSLRCKGVGRHAVQGPEGGAFELDEKEMREYARRYLGMMDGPAVSARERFHILAKHYAAEHSVSEEVAMLAIARTERGKDLWEQARLAELEDGERGRGW